MLDFYCILTLHICSLDTNECRKISASFKGKGVSKTTTVRGKGLQGGLRLREGYMIISWNNTMGKRFEHRRVLISTNP